METMKQPPKPQPNTALRDELDTMPGIPGKWLTFTTPRDPQLRLADWNGSGRGNLAANDRISIVWLLKVQMYRITEKALKVGEPDHVIYVPQSWAAFE